MNFWRILVGVLLIVSALNLSAMVPGGPVETRDFSAISPIILGGFNLFLTSLGLGSFVLAYVLLSRRWNGHFLAGLFGVGYFAVYALDLAYIFPQSPTPMPPLLFKLEWLGVASAAPLAGAAFMQAFRKPEQGQGGASAIFSAPVILAIAILVLAIVTFATYSAMGL